MVRARRAKRSPARAVVAAVVAAAVVAGLVGLQQGWFTGDRTTTASPSLAAASPSSSTQPGAAPGSSATASSSDPTPSAAGSTDANPSSSAAHQSPTPSDASTSAEPTPAAAQSALAKCSESVHAADRVIKAAHVGIGHWSEHVQAQTDANKGKISLATMDAIFKRTRLDGPEDVSDYTKARDKAGDHSSSCQPPDGAPAATKTKMSDCRARSEAQQPVLAAAEDGMDDWESHLAAMQRSRMGHVHDAQGVWIRAWRAAPPHIKAFSRAENGFDAPTC